MEDKNRKMQEMQMVEQNLQNLVMQKQAFQFELSETEVALKEVENSEDDVFKVIGQLMIKSDKKKIEKELSDKKRVLELRVDAFDKQEKVLNEKFEKAREEFIKANEKQ